MDIDLEKIQARLDKQLMESTTAGTACIILTPGELKELLRLARIGLEKE